MDTNLYSLQEIQNAVVQKPALLLSKTGSFVVDDDQEQSRGASAAFYFTPSHEMSELVPLGIHLIFLKP